MGSSLSSPAPPALPPRVFLSAKPILEPSLYTPGLAELFYYLLGGMELSLLFLGVYPVEVVLSPAPLVSLVDSLALGNGFFSPGCEIAAGLDPPAFTTCYVTPPALILSFNDLAMGSSSSSGSNWPAPPAALPPPILLPT